MKEKIVVNEKLLKRFLTLLEQKAIKDSRRMMKLWQQLTRDYTVQQSKT